jgi:hypothetical protein
MLTNTEPTNQMFTNKKRTCFFLGTVFMIFTVCCLFIVFGQTNAHENLIAKKHILQSIIFDEEQEQRDTASTCEWLFCGGLLGWAMFCWTC